ncbi:hypothetical protein B0T26DRAFT_675309 [Lasiosphaeria miniovina]|uniref:Uncharacterized protein n=1 Tax=Lasiosphaeria miniovina TaxID=1954250 RepID=A0AA40DVA6_9PEZI|nr:uncharacterized protein B0T26DRAFT_675309 [Lasiosphaeria miniovina]KAK0716900.1 hypothetical protein B0T26DRAFT_675309 [Lasiosphaeria miniovina]
MKPSKVLPLLACCVSSALGAAMSPVVDPSDAIIAAFAATSNLKVGDNYEGQRSKESLGTPVQCQVSSPNHDGYAVKKWYLKEGLGYLREPGRMCNIAAGQTGCGRISCSWGAAVYLCAHNAHGAKIDLPCSDAAELVSAVLNTCRHDYKDTLVKGLAWDAEKRFSVELYEDRC